MARLMNNMVINQQYNIVIMNWKNGQDGQLDVSYWVWVALKSAKTVGIILKKSSSL